MKRNSYVLDKIEDTWTLTDSVSGDENTLVLEIKYGFFGTSVEDFDNPKFNNKYRFLVYRVDGSAVQVMELEAWKATAAAIQENEGDEEYYEFIGPHSWARTPAVDGDQWNEALKLFRSMVRHWEGLQDTGMFTPAVNNTASFRSLR